MPGKAGTSQDSYAAFRRYLVKRDGACYLAGRMSGQSMEYHLPGARVSTCQRTTKEPRQALKQFKSLCSACVGRFPSFSKTIYCGRPAWPYSPCLMQTARLVFVCLCSNRHRGHDRAGLRRARGAAWSPGVERQPAPARSALTPAPGLAGIRAACSSPRGTTSVVPCSCASAPEPPWPPGKGAVVSEGERRGVGEAG